MTKEDIDQYLAEYCVNAECVELKTKFNSYKSFKVGVTHDIYSSILHADFWPSGTLVRKFVQRSRPIDNKVFTRTFLGKGASNHQTP